MSGPRVDPEHGLVWPVTLQLAGGSPVEIGTIPAGDGPERAMADLALMLHEWADFISTTRGRLERTLEVGVPAPFPVPVPDPSFAAIEEQAIRAAAAAYRHNHRTPDVQLQCAHGVSLARHCPTCEAKNGR